MTRRLWTLAAVLFGVLGAGLLLAGPASAHASVLKSDPADGTRLRAAPHTVTITFDESVGLGSVGYLHVTDQNGRRVDARAAYHPGGQGNVVADDLTSGLADGTYTESFRVVSADSHPVTGTVRFVVGLGALVRGGGPAGPTVNSATSKAFDVSRWISFAGLAVLGGGWLVFTVWPAGRDDRGARRLVWTGWAGLTGGALLELLLQGPYTAGAALTKVGELSLLDDTLHTNYGQLHCLRLVLLGLIALVFARSLQADARPARWEAVLGALGLGVVLTFSASGHGATTSPAWLSVGLDAVHLTAMATWIGGLIMLVTAVLPRREPDELRDVLPVFSRTAFVAVVALAASGTYAAWRGIGTVHAIFSTTYGLLVVSKVVLFAGLLALGNFSRVLIRRRTVAYAMTDTVVLDDGPDPFVDDVTTERIRRSVYVEAIIGLVVLGLSAVLVAQPRGKEALLAAYRAPVTAAAPLGGGRTVTVTADPGTHGPVTFSVELSPGPGATAITATATQQQAQIGPLPIKLTREGGRLFDGSATLPVSGRWTVALVVTASEFDATTTDVTITLH
jgi:copper transport protein